MKEDPGGTEYSASRIFFLVEATYGFRAAALGRYQTRIDMDIRSQGLCRIQLGVIFIKIIQMAAGCGMINSRYAE